MRALFILLILISFNTQAQIVEATPTIPTNEYLDLLADHLELPNELTAKYANQDIELTIVLTITKEGSVFNSKIQNDTLQLEPYLKKAVGNLPKWNPQTEDGNPVVSRKAFKLIIPMYHTIAEEAIAGQAYVKATPKEGFPTFMRRFVQEFHFERSKVSYDIKMRLRFFIEKDGSLTNIEVSEANTPLFHSEAIRVIKGSKWNPATQDGVPVRSQFTMPITIRLQ